MDNTVVHRSKHEQAEEQAFEATAIIQGFTTRLLFDGRKKGKHAGNSEVGEKQHSDEYDSDNDETIDQDEAHRAKAGVHKEDAQNGEGTDAQGMQSAAVVVGGEKIIPHHELSEKERKRIAAREAKRKRDELVSKMIKQTELGLGAFADFTEMMTKSVTAGVASDSWLTDTAPCRLRSPTQTALHASRSPARFSFRPCCCSILSLPGFLVVPPRSCLAWACSRSRS